MPHVLIVDDDASTCEVLVEVVRQEGLTAAVAKNLREAQIHIVRQLPDVIFTDLRLPDGNGIDLFKDIDLVSNIEIIVITGHATVESAVNALKLGATDYLVKPINLQRVKAILSRIPRAGDLKAEIGNLRGELRRFGKFGLMLGNSNCMQAVYDQINKVAPTAASVLLIGNSGTGKEVAAQTIHELSLRKKHPFIAVNCGAISPNLIESEMFGHERGSFTGADRQHKGYFERANGGTLFLDEVTEMPIELQVKLLRVLETGVFMRVGTTKEIETDVRLVAATNRDPEEAVAMGNLRLDLYHRLNVFPIQLPTLSERGLDIQLLAEYFLSRLNEKYSTSRRFNIASFNKMLAYHWPGNVRELKNYVQRAYIMATDNTVSTDTVPLQISLTKPTSISAINIPFGISLADADRQLILATFEACGGIKTKAADMLGISLKTLSNRLIEYGVNDQTAIN